jgi:NAD(P)-dependent dehydrogenase (short-subunit alcohol dehydrogenase family)
MGKTVIITGATSGIGLATAQLLACEVDYLFLLGKDEVKGRLAMESIKQTCSAVEVYFYSVDMAVLSQVREVAEEILRHCDRIDVIINNAGVFRSKRLTTINGMDVVFVVNYLSHFLLTYLLYPAVRKSKNGRIINIGSGNHIMTRMHFDDLSLSKNYRGLYSYAQSKLAMVYFTYELDRRKSEDHITINCMSPGRIDTNIGVKYSNLLHGLIWRFLRGRAADVGVAAKVLHHMAISQELKNISGKYFKRFKITNSSKRSYNKEDGARLWQISMDMCGIKDFFHQ